MGKKRTAKKTGGRVDENLKNRALSRVSRKKLENAVLRIRSSYNNTILALTDEAGNVATWASAGTLGFEGTKKGTPYAAAKVAELMAEKTKLMDVKNIDVEIKGIGTGRESAVRSFITHAGAEIRSIKDITPIAHGGVRPPKPRRV